MSKNPSPLINDEQYLVGATSRFGRPIKVYDDGYGQIFIHRDSMGISGIVRAATWEDAYSICEDEFFPEADETVDELRKEYNFRREYIKIIRSKTYGLDGNTVVNTSVGEKEASDEDYPLADNGWEFVRWETRDTPGLDADGCGDEDLWVENELFQEAYGFRPNGPRVGDVHKHGIYAKDLNGDALDVLTPKFLKELEITLEIKTKTKYEHHGRSENTN